MVIAFDGANDDEKLLIVPSKKTLCLAPFTVVVCAFSLWSFFFFSLFHRQVLNVINQRPIKDILYTSQRM